MIGRNKNWTGPSDWINEFNKVHNPDIFYGKQKKTKEKKNAPQKKELALDFIASEELNDPIYFYPL